MSSRAELKQKAKNLLDGKKGKGALMTFLYYLMPFLFAFIPFVGPVVNIICMPVLTYGLLKALIDLKNGEEVGALISLQRDLKILVRFGVFQYVQHLKCGDLYF